MLGVSARSGLVVAKTRHLGPHERAVGDVVVAQGRGGGIAGELGVGVEEGRAQVGAAQPFQVHRQERDVVEDVDVAQVVVEVEAVQHPRPVGEAEHVVGDQVAVSVHHPPIDVPPGEEVTPTVHEPRCQPVDLVDEAVGEQRTPVPGEFRDVGPPTPAQCCRRAVDGDARSASGVRVEGRHQPGQIAQLVPHRCARHDERRQSPVGGHAAHHEHGLVGLVRAGEPAEAQVHVRGDPAVELQLAAQGRRPPIRRGEVEERGPHRLLGLVGAVTDQDHHPDVGLGDHRRAVADRRAFGVRHARSSGLLRCSSHGCRPDRGLPALVDGTSVRRAARG